MSIFDRLERMASRTVDAVNSIPFVFTPMKTSPNGRPVPDPARAIVEGRGIFDYLEADSPIELGNRDRRGNDLRALVEGAGPVLSVDRAMFPALAYEPRQGDVVQFAGRPDLPTFAVVSVRRDGLSRVELRLAST